MSCWFCTRTFSFGSEYLPSTRLVLWREDLVQRPPTQYCTWPFQGTLWLYPPVSHSCSRWRWIGSLHASAPGSSPWGHSMSRETQMGRTVLDIVTTSHISWSWWCNCNIGEKKSVITLMVYEMHLMNNQFPPQISILTDLIWHQIDVLFLKYRPWHHQLPPLPLIVPDHSRWSQRYFCTLKWRNILLW